MNPLVSLRQDGHRRCFSRRAEKRVPHFSKANTERTYSLRGGNPFPPRKNLYILANSAAGRDSCRAFSLCPAYKTPRVHVLHLGMYLMRKCSTKDGHGGGEYPTGSDPPSLEIKLELRFFPFGEGRTRITRYGE
jgi:hypothetical protein